MPVVRPLLSADLETVLQIQAACPEAAQWPAVAWLRVLPNFIPLPSSSVRQLLSNVGAAFKPAPLPAVWGAEDQRTVVGFIAVSFAADEMEILNLAVAPSARRAGVGSQLLDAVLNEARFAGVRRIFLEVRASNSAASAFYTRHGFSLSSRRPNYYSSPAEDALVLSFRLTPDT